jgi:hypothetical protein
MMVVVNYRVTIIMISYMCMCVCVCFLYFGAFYMDITSLDVV